MKLSPSFIEHNTGRETLLVPTAEASFHGLVQGNPTASFILNCLKNDTTEEEIVAAMQREYSGDVEAMREDVAEFIGQLKKIGAVVD